MTPYHRIRIVSYKRLGAYSFIIPLLLRQHISKCAYIYSISETYTFFILPSFLIIITRQTLYINGLLLGLSSLALLTRASLFILVVLCHVILKLYFSCLFVNRIKRQQVTRLWKKKTQTKPGYVSNWLEKGMTLERKWAIWNGPWDRWDALTHKDKKRTYIHVHHKEKILIWISWIKDTSKWWWWWWWWYEQQAHSSPLFFDITTTTNSIIIILSVAYLFLRMIKFKWSLYVRHSLKSGYKVSYSEERALESGAQRLSAFAFCTRVI